ncbi:hypothetical protein ABPG74_008769 [Tetrahymena malaccensis]
MLALYNLYNLISYLNYQLLLKNLMKKVLVFIFLVVASQCFSFDLWGALSFGSANREEPQPKKKQQGTGLMRYFEPKRLEFNLPKCLRNIADIIEEVENLKTVNSFEVTLEKVVEKVAHYSEMLVSCGFAFQYQQVFKLFNTVKNMQMDQQGTCGESQSEQCGGQMLNQEIKVTNQSTEQSFYQKILPCATKIQEIYTFYSQKTFSLDTNYLEESKIFVQSIVYAEECSLLIFNDFMESSKPCLSNFDKLVNHYHEITKSSSIYLGLISQGPTMISTFNEMVSVCKDQIFEAILPANQNEQ